MPRPPLRTAAPAIAAVLAACSFPVGCGGGSEPVAEGTRTAAPSSTSAPSSTDVPSSSAEPSTSTTTTAPRGPLGNGETVTLAFAGDSSFQGLNEAAQQDPQGLLAAITPALGAADLTMVNFEAALGTGGVAVDKQFVFQAPEAALDALESAGVDVVTMANNHGMDYGIGGLLDSLRIRRDGGFPVLGIGVDAEDAYSPFVTEVRGQRIGFIAASDVIDDSLEAEWSATDASPGIASAEEPHQQQLVERVAALRPQVDTLVVYLHYGTEKETCPNARQQELVEMLSAAGADVVVGSHAHRLQGMGLSGDTFVAYGLSNFVFRSSGEGARSGVLNLAVTGRRVDGYLWSPATIQGGIPVPLSGPEADAERSAVAGLSQCAGLSDDLPEGDPVG